MCVTWKMLLQNGKTRVMLLHHPPGGKQKLGRQAHDFGAPSVFPL